MRLALVLLFGFVSSVVVSGTEYYAETFNSVNVDTILNSDRLFNQYMDCILDVGPCTADGRTLRCKCAVSAASLLYLDVAIVFYIYRIFSQMTKENSIFEEGEKNGSSFRENDIRSPMNIYRCRST